MQVKLAQRPQRDRQENTEELGARPRPRLPTPNEAPLGISVRELDQGAAGRVEVPGGVQGVVVSRVDPTGAAFQSPLRRGFVIMEINKRPVKTVRDYQRLVAAARPGEVLAMFVYDPTLGQRSLVAVTVE